jgi:filamentous hemagglutinin
MGGVFNTVNLHLYHYAGNNPLKYTDPDGKVPFLVVTGAIGALIGGGASIFSDVASGNEIDWGRAGVSAVAGGLAGLTLGGAAAMAVTGTALTAGSATASFGAVTGYGVASTVATGAAATTAAGNAGSGVWKLNPFARGKAIEQSLGMNLPGNFPTIDRFTNGVATSIKSLDLGAASYQSTSALSRTVTGYIDSVAGFNGVRWAGVNIQGSQIAGRALDLAIPSAGSAAQQQVLQRMIQYGQSVGVNVNVLVFP